MTGYHGDGDHVGLAAIVAHVKQNETWQTRFENIDYTKPHGYTTTQTYPYGDAPLPLTVYYYDNYDWVATSGSGLSGTLNTSDISGSNFFTTYNASPDYAQELKQSLNTVGLVTGVKTNTVPAGSLLAFAINIYDHKGRVIQVQSTNFTGGKDIVTMQYNFNNLPVRKVTRHEKGGSNAQTHIISEKLEYDDLGRQIVLRRIIS